MSRLPNLNLLHKQIRSQVIKQHLAALGTNNCVCFTSGNAAKYLRKAGVSVVAIGEGQDLMPAKWFTYGEIAATFGLFDATCGHLPWPLMLEVADKIKYALRDIKLPASIMLPTGSGETLVCLKLAYPQLQLTAVYDNSWPPTAFSEQAPLNELVKHLSTSIIFK